MSTVRAITQLKAAKEKSLTKIEHIKEKAATAIMLEEELIKAIDASLMPLENKVA